jgi:hypothetical protein
MSASELINEYKERLKKSNENFLHWSKMHAFYLADFEQGWNEIKAFRPCKYGTEGIFATKDIYGEGFQSLIFKEQLLDERKCSNNWKNGIRQFANTVLPRTNQAAQLASETKREIKAIEKEIEKILGTLTSTPEAQQAIEEIKNEIKNETTEKTKQRKLIRYGILILLSLIILFSIVYIIRKPKNK